jgi:molybdopterin-containing oxidoreductase family iron-sulfur binding subunit
MALWGMVIDLDRCTGCQACVMACKAENNVPAVGAREAGHGRIISWMQVLTEEDEAHPGEVKRFLPRPCLQCDDPPCTKVCPVYATYRNPEGIVAQIYARCIGCRFCMAACPYNAVKPRGHQKDGPGRVGRVGPRHRGSTFATTAPEGPGACSPSSGPKPGVRPRLREACPARAITFGDLSDPGSEVSRLARSPRAFRLQEELGTKPKVIYLTEGERHG